jgi:hypothetical protein
MAQINLDMDEYYDNKKKKHQTPLYQTEWFFF